LKGYAGKILKIDLSSKRIGVENLDEEMARNYIGGSGLAAGIIYHKTLPQVNPLAPENLLVFMTGPFTSTNIPTSGRHAIASKSPLTGIWGEADVGGSWGIGLKRAGYDGIEIMGAAEKPVYLWVHDEEAEIREAQDLWGVDTYRVEALLKEKTNEKASVACIGPAGESLVKFATIMHNGRNARAAGRCGLGAVIGSKKLKGIVVSGRKKAGVAHKEKLRKAIKEIVPKMRELTKFMKEYGTSGSTEVLEKIGDMPIKNWLQGRWPQGAKNLSGITMRKTIFSGHYACKTCPIACGKEVKITQGKYRGVEGAAAEYETVGTLGTLCLVDDLEAVSMANQLCNQYGIDTISTGGAIAFAMEAYEKGLITLGDLDNLELRWGNAEAMVEMVRRIGERQGLGRLLGEGVRRAAEEIGGTTSEFAMHVKGLELPAHDPRAFYSLALAYATSNRGACHLQAYSHPLEGWITMPDLGYPDCLPPHTEEGKAILVAKLQDLMCMFDSLKICKYALYGGVRAHHLTEYLNLVTDWGLDLTEFMKIGERIFNLKRLYNIKGGISRKDDTLPSRLLTRPRTDHGATGNLPHLGKMLNEYYSYRGWSEEGIPLDDKIRELGLLDV
jgi:aldehyde:ferredoxin oxidoreductase